VLDVLKDAVRTTVPPATFARRGTACSAWSPRSRARPEARRPSSRTPPRREPLARAAAPLEQLRAVTRSILAGIDGVTLERLERLVARPAKASGDAASDG